MKVRFTLERVLEFDEKTIQTNHPQLWKEILPYLEKGEDLFEMLIQTTEGWEITSTHKSPYIVQENILGDTLEIER